MGIELRPAELSSLRNQKSAAPVDNSLQRSNNYYAIEGYPEKFESLKDAVGIVNPDKPAQVYQHVTHDLGSALVTGIGTGIIAGLVAFGGVMAVAGFFPNIANQMGLGLLMSSVPLVGVATGFGTGIRDYLQERDYNTGSVVNKPFNHPEGPTHNHLTWVYVYGCQVNENIVSDLTAQVEKDKPASVDQNR
ncbi:MAG: hypothetical protein HYU64_19230 [Armatimonadetes bacterium]|nr:hypothetical protein [Armatimonadota bacterium]